MIRTAFPAIILFACFGVLTDSVLENLPPIHRWLNRLLAIQNAIFEGYQALIQARIDAMRERGTLDIRVETLTVERIAENGAKLLRRDPGTVEGRWMRLDLHRRRWSRSVADALQDWSDSDRVRPLRNMRSGKVALMVPSWPILDDEGDEIAFVELRRPSGSERIRVCRLEESAWEDIDQEAFHAAWHAECAEIADRLDIELIIIATGLLLPGWDRLPDDDLRVWRINDDHGRSLLGRIISVERVAKAFGLDRTIRLSPAELVTGARDHAGVAIAALGGGRLHRRHVNDEARLEIRDFEPSRLASLKAIGCFTEIIRDKTRLFLPTARAVDILIARGDVRRRRFRSAGSGLIRNRGVRRKGEGAG